MPSRLSYALAVRAADRAVPEGMVAIYGVPLMILSRRSIFTGLAALGAMVGLGLPVLKADPLPLDPAERLAFLRKTFLHRARATERSVMPLWYTDPTVYVQTLDTAIPISTVSHPLLLEAVLKFQASAAGELLPAHGPAHVYAHHQVLGRGATDIEAIDDWYSKLPQGQFETVVWRAEPELAYETDFDRQTTEWQVYSRMACIPAMEAS
jgi:hypothetical protein